MYNKICSIDGMGKPFHVDLVYKMCLQIFVLLGKCLMTIVTILDFTLSLSVTVSPEIYGIVSGDRLPSPRIQRGMMLLSKILQNLANHVLFKKEKHMLVFNDFLKENFERSRELVTCV